jgi:hypothetical protein
MPVTSVVKKYLTTDSKKNGYSSWPLHHFPEAGKMVLNKK